MSRRQLPDWPALPGVRALFTLRTGGASRAPYASSIWAGTSAMTPRR